MMNYVGFVCEYNGGMARIFVEGDTIAEVIGEMYLKDLISKDFDSNAGDYAAIYNADTKELVTFFTSNKWEIRPN